MMTDIHICLCVIYVVYVKYIVKIRIPDVKMMSLI